MTSSGSKLLERAPFVAVLLLGFPLAIATLFQVSFNLSEVWIFGQIGDRGASLAGAAASDIVTGIFALLASGLGNAAVAKISYCHGAGDRVGERRHARQAMVAAAILSVCSAIVGLLADPIGAAIMAEGAPREAGTEFLRIMATGGFGTIFVAFGIAVLRSQGDTVRPLAVVAVMSIANLFLEAVFILGLFGVEPRSIVAAAWITVTIRALAAIMLVWLIHRHVSLRPPKGERFINYRALANQFRLGFTAALQQSVRLMGFLVLLFVVSKRFSDLTGSSEFTAINIWIKIEIPTIMLGFAWGGATAPLVGMGLGASRPVYSRQAAWSGVLFGIVSSVVMMAVVFFFSSVLVATFVPDDPAVLGLTRQIFIWAAPVYPFLTTGVVIATAFNGAGNMRVPLLWDLATILVVQSVLVGVLAHPAGLGITGIGLAVMVSRVLQGAIPTMLLHRESRFWVRRQRSMDEWEKMTAELNLAREPSGER